MRMQRRKEAFSTPAVKTLEDNSEKTSLETAGVNIDALKRKSVSLGRERRKVKLFENFSRLFFSENCRGVREEEG